MYFPIALNKGMARSTASGESQPSMNVASPVRMAWRCVCVMGASMSGSPRALSSSLRARVSKGDEEDMSTTMVPV